MKRSRLSIGAGVLLMLVGLLWSGAAIESFFNRAPGELSWGTTVFRALLVLHGALLLGAGLRKRAKLPPGEPVFRGEKAWVIGVLIALTVVGFALRVLHLGTSLWLDEILTMVDFAKPPMKEILTSFPNQNQHMLFSILAHWSLNIFGESAWALRVPSVLFGLASIWALFLLGRKILGVREALLACTLMTVSYHHIWFSQNARGYMGVLFFSILATWLWLEAMSRGRARWWVAYAVALFLGMWIHMTILFLIAGHGLVWLLDCARKRRIDWRPVGAWALCATLTLQFLGLTLPEFFRSAVHEVSQPSEWTNPLWVIRESFRSLRVGFAGAAVVLGGGLFVLAGWTGILRRDWKAGLAFVLPGVLGAASMIALGHNLWPRFFFFCMGFALLVVVHGAMMAPQVLPASDKARRAMGTAFAGLIILASLATVPRVYSLPKQDFTGARDYVEQRRAQGEAVVTVGLANHAYGKYYAPRWITATTAAELEKARRENGSVSLVYTLPIELKAFHPQLWAAVQRDFEEVKVFPGTLGGGEVYVCRERRNPVRLEATGAKP